MQLVLTVVKRGRGMGDAEKEKGRHGDRRSICRLLFVRYQSRLRISPSPLLLFSHPSASLTDVLKLTRQIGIFLRDARIKSLKIATICAAHELKTREVRLRSQLASRALRTESVAAKFYERQGSSETPARDGPRNLTQHGSLLGEAATCPNYRGWS